jgi:3-deoxy-D-manno-octulosonate 8-phosphate phosphatase (KDO 8-P phosphatase)
MHHDDPLMLNNLFKGSFLISQEATLEKLLKVRAFVFDWDGVFNNGFKDASGSSPFSEVDSMGINMLRFSYYLRTGHNPVTAIISGERNTAAFTLGSREHFHSVYSKIRHKKDAMHHLCTAHGLAPSEIAFFFDDILDLSMAEECGLRMQIGRKGSPLFTRYVSDRLLADYITEADGSGAAIREASELLIGLAGNYDGTIAQRVSWSDNYQQYLAERNTILTNFYTISGSEIIQQTN